MTDHITGPGLLFVRSRIAQEAKDTFDEKTFLHWYDDEHIPEVVASSGIKSGFRYLDIYKTSPLGNDANPKPFLAVYPMRDTAFTTTDEFKNLRVKSDKLPGSGLIYDLADMDVSVLGLGGKTDRTGSAESGPAKVIITCGVRTPPAASPDAKAAFVKELMALVSEASGYSRTLTFELQFARSNAQSRALKGLPAGNDKGQELSTWLAVYEFETKPSEELVRALKGEVRKLEKKVGNADGEVYAWELQRVHGEKKMFD